MPCDRTTRREFIRRGGCGLFTCAALGLAADAGALPIALVSSQGTAGERRFAIPTADGVNIDRRAQVILVRQSNKVYAMALACPHENAAVKWIRKDGRFQCSKHDSRYTPDGTYTSGHATRNLDRFPVRLDGASVVVAVDRVYRSDQNRPAWIAAFVEVPG
jgi:Rieske Fe-S protein